MFSEEFKARQLNSELFFSENLVVPDESSSARFFKKLKQKLKSIPASLVILVVFLAIMIIASLLKRSGTTTEFYEAPKISVLVALIPIQKGQMLNPAFLKQIDIPMKELTPKQRLDRLITEQVENYSNFILRAKKNIPPHKIIFWSDLNFESPQSIGKPRTAIKVFYGDKGN